MGKIILLFFSLSLRSANLPGLPFDYEVKGGIQTEQMQVSMLKEREVGGMYYGMSYNHNIKIDDRIKTEVEWYCRTAKDINYQSFRALYPFGMYFTKCHIGATLNADRWVDVKPLLSYRLTSGETVFSIETNFADREILCLEIGKTFLAKSGIYLKPLFVYRSSGESRFWQTKIEIGINFKEWHEKEINQ